MTSFQKDFLLTINNSHNYYINKMDELFNNSTLLEELSVENAEKLIEYLKEYKKLINLICGTLDNINNIKISSNLSEKIEKELLLKMMPIMNVYRTLLFQKYSDVDNLD